MRFTRLPIALCVLLSVQACHADLIKQNSTYNRVVYMQDSTAARSPGVAGLTLTIAQRKVGGAFATIMPTVTDLGGGWYDLAITGAMNDTLGARALKVTATGADETDALDQIVAFDPADAAALGLSRLDVAVSSRLSTSVAPADSVTVMAINAVLVKLNTMLLAIGGSYQYTVQALAQGSSTPVRPYMVYLDNASPTRATLTFQKGDNGVQVQETLKYPNGAPIDLTNKTVSFQLVPVAGGTAIVDQAASIAFASGGVAYYVLTATDLSTAGTFYRRWRVTDVSGNVITYPNGAALTVVVHP